MGFRYPSYRRLKTALGSEGAFLELIEIGLGELKSSASACPEGVEAYIVAAAKRNGLHLRYRDWPHTLAGIAHLYIVQANRIADEFLSDFRREYIEFFGTAWAEKGKESRIDNVIANVGCKTISELPEYDLYQYYLDIRHVAAHSHDLRELDKLDRKHAALVADHGTQFVASLGGLPHKRSEIEYEDFVLFSRAIKAIARTLSNQCRPSNATLYASVAVSPRLRRFTNRPDRAAGATATLLRERYGLGTEEAAEIVNTYGPLAQR